MHLVCISSRCKVSNQVSSLASREIGITPIRSVVWQAVSNQVSSLASRELQSQNNYDKLFQFGFQSSEFPSE